ncbi:InlB B-repeat-containing protein [Paenibacillus amylolyticus]|uniref:InlB B-repeat-containing protein n=1 Tax=Paenibacillus amylolyticus TaxID=1451 RepID=UPI003EB8836A
MNKLKKTRKRGWKLKSRLLALMLVISMVVGLLPMQQAAAAEPSEFQNVSLTDGYQDVNPTDWFYDAVIYVQKNGIFNGTGADIFSPKGTMTRAMYMTALGRMAGVDISKYPISTFADVQTGAWYAPYIEWAAEKGITKGTGDQNFSPDATVSREQMATMTLRYFESYQIPYQTGTHITTKPSDLVSVSSWAVDAVIKLWQAGLFVGDANGNFNPHAQATRAEAAASFMRSNAVVGAWKEQSQEPPTPTPPPTSNTDNGSNNGDGGNSGANNGGNSSGNNNTEHALTFESNGGTSVAGQTVKYGSKAMVPKVPTKLGYVFSGWYSDNDLTVPYDFTTAVVTGNITLYAKWAIDKKNSYSVKFDSNGGSAVFEQKVEEGAVAAAPDAPTQEGYTFDGWYSDSDLGSPYGFTAAVTGNITLYAKWTKNSYTVSFDSNGGSAVAPQTVRTEEMLSKLPAPTKEGSIFQGWFRDEDYSLIFAEGSTVNTDTKLYAKYIDNVSNAVENNPGYSVLDVEPNFTIAVNAVSSSMTAAEVKAGMTFIDTAYPDPIEPAVTSANGHFTVASAAEDGKFVEGNTYQLTLTDDRLTFQGQDATTRIYVFSVAKQEVMNIPLNPNMVYLDFKEVENMMLDGVEVGSPAIPIITMGMDGGGLAAANAGSGTFQYTGDASIQVGATVAIYEGVRPDQRTVNTTGMDDGDIAYVQITKINGTTYTYTRADIMQVLFMPDVLPVNIDMDMDGDQGKNSITVEQAAMNYSDVRYEPYGLSELTTVDIGDFIAFYEGGLAEGDEDFKVISYGRITSIVPEAEMMVIAYDDATPEDIKHVFDIYQEQEIDGETLLSEVEIGQLEDQIEQQAIDSGFVNQAASYLSTLARETDVFKTQMEVKGLAASRVAGKVSVENVTVKASLGTRVKNIAGRTSGVSATLQVGADIVIRIHEESDLVIHMTGTFLEEISLSLNVNGNAEWEEICGFLGCMTLPFPKDYRITANLDAYSYTGLNITAEIATVEHDKLAEALGNWDAAKNGGKLGKVLDIATEIQALLDGVQDSGVDAESLKERYKEMMENETEWVPLVKIKLFKQSLRVALNIVEIEFSAEFVVSANANLTVGADFNYMTAKRLSATLRVKDFSGNVHTTRLQGDGDYQFTFYVMGMLGLRAGIQLELKAGIGSVDWNSIGISVEPGAYVNLWGYFYYQLKDISGKRLTKSFGALYVEMGIYLESAIGAQLGDGLVSASVPIYEEKWPLYTVGEQHNITDFAYPQDDSLGLNLAGSATSIALPDSLFKMSLFDLKTGATNTRAYALSSFDVQVDSPNFRYNATTKKIEVVDTSGTVSKGNLVITWKGAPLSFTSDPIKRTIPLTWRIKPGEYTLQLDPQNGEMTEIVVARPNAVISVTALEYPGYTFDGWFTEATGGTKMTIPSTMPAEDLNLYAHWTVNTDTPYTVQHYLIDPNTGTSASPVVTETLTGTTDTEIQINSDRFKDQGYTNGTASGVYIKGDGSTVVRVEYYPTDRTLTFNGGYAGAPTSSITALFGKNIAARIPVLTRPGYTFAGWSPEVPNIMPTSDITYTATWTAREDTPYKVVYLLQNIGSDTYTVADTESHRGITDTVVNMTNPRSYVGFTFDNSVPRTVQMSKIAGEGTTVLKLYYTRNNYAMTINYNSSGVETDVVNVPFGATTGLHIGTPTWQGHTFTGWSPVPPTTMPTQNVTITAGWTTNSYKVSFNSNGGSPVAAQTVGYGLSASKPDEPMKDGMVFSGWYSDGALTKAYDFATLVTADLTLYAQWMYSYKVSFESNGGSAVAAQRVNEGDKATAVVPTKEGFVFSGWYSDMGLKDAYDFETRTVTGSIILYAKWTIVPKNNYVVSFNSNEGTEVANLTVEEGAVAKAPDAPTREGYTFTGWYSDINLKNSFNFSITPITMNLSLHAGWLRNSYTASFDSMGGTEVAAQKVNEGENIAAPVVPMNEGYMFGGWYKDVNMSEAYDFATPVTTHLTLYAKWKVLYTVSFNSNGGSSVADQLVTSGDNAMAPAVPTPVVPEIKDLVFDGWYSDEGLSEAYSFTTAVRDNLTLYAKWVVPYTVSFDAGRGWYMPRWPAESYKVFKQTVASGGKATPPDLMPVFEGYLFRHWYTDTSADIMEVYDFTTPVTEDLTLRALWWQRYIVKFHTKGGTKVADQEPWQGEPPTKPEDPTLEGYTFAGWYSDSARKEPYDFTTMVPYNGEYLYHTLHAKWIWTGRP